MEENLNGSLLFNDMQSITLNVSCFRLSQLAKASKPMLVIVDGIVIDDNPSKP